MTDELHPGMSAIELRSEHRRAVTLKSLSVTAAQSDELNKLMASAGKTKRWHVEEAIRLELGIKKPNEPELITATARIAVSWLDAQPARTTLAAVVGHFRKACVAQGLPPPTTREARKHIQQAAQPEASYPGIHPRKRAELLPAINREQTNQRPTKEVGIAAAPAPEARHSVTVDVNGALRDAFEVYCRGRGETLKTATAYMLERYLP